MQVAGIVFHQVLIMFCMIAIGIVFAKTRMVTVEAARSFSSVLLKVVCPCILINACRQERTPERTRALLVAFVLSIAYHLIAIGLSRLLIKKDGTTRYRLERMAAVYSNCGFMAFPILEALLGPEGVFYATPFVAVFNIVLWTEGIKTLRPETKLSPKKCILNPGCIGVMIGLATYFFQIPYPDFLEETLVYVAGMNTPLSMIITGIFLSAVSVPKTIKDRHVLKAISMRTLAVPLVFLALEAILQVTRFFPVAREACIVTTLCGACPSAASIILFPASYGMDEEGKHGARLVAFSTLVSIATLPFVTFLTYRLL